MFAKEALEEIEQCRHQAMSLQHQLDWRWVERYRALASYDGHWWLAHAGPFTREEQHQWDQLSTQTLDDITKEQLSRLLVQSRQRELVAAIAEQREPRLRYPAIDITDVRRRITDLLQLDAEISQKEPNAIVCRLYHGTIEEEVDFLRLIEATYEGDTEQFWQCNRRLNPEPTLLEMKEALSHFKRILLRGLQQPETREVGQQVVQLLGEQLKLSLDLSDDEAFDQETQQDNSAFASSTTRRVTAQTAKRFFEAVLRESSCEQWQVKIDPNASGPCVEHGLRCVFLPDEKVSVEQIRHFLAHELAGQIIARFQRRASSDLSSANKLSLVAAQLSKNGFNA